MKAMKVLRPVVFLILASCSLMAAASCSSVFAAEAKGVASFTPKDLLESLTMVVTILGGLGALILAWYRWGPHSGPPLFIREIILIPPGTQADLKGGDMMIAADLILINPGPVSEYLIELCLSIHSPAGTIYHYSPYIFADPSAFEDTSKRPKWVKSFYHPMHIPGSDRNMSTHDLSKCVLFIPDQKSPYFFPEQGRYAFEFVFRRFSIVPWRKQEKLVMNLDVDEAMALSLTPRLKASKVAFLDWHFIHTLQK